jgi:hypothetical protein
MAVQRKRRRRPWGSLIFAVVLFAVAFGILLYVPASPLNRTHITSDTNPVGTLPPTAPRATPTPTLTVTVSATVSPSVTP